MQQVSVRTLVAMAAVLMVVGCGGGGSDLGPARSLTVGTVAYVLPAGGATVDLELGEPDLVLAAALSAVSAGYLFNGSDLVPDDLDTLPAGQTQTACDSGSLSRLIEISGSTRTVILDADQCFFDDAGDDSVSDGSLQVARATRVGGGFQGTAVIGGGSGSFASADRIADESLFEFGQLRGTITFEYSGANDISTVTDGRVLIGLASPAEPPQALLPVGRLEMRIGTSALAFETFTERQGNRRELDVAGPISIRGSDLDASCNVTGRFNAATATTVVYQEDPSGDRATGGVLTLNAGSQNATVQFLGNGSAVVIDAGGQSTTYPLAAVLNHCGLGPD